MKEEKIGRQSEGFCGREGGWKAGIADWETWIEDWETENKVWRQEETVQRQRKGVGWLGVGR
jgi:hypothetical protein